MNFTANFTNAYKTATMLVVLLGLISPISRAQNCTVNAGVNKSTCNASSTLDGNVNGIFTGTPRWTFVSGPATPTIVSPNAITSNVTGLSASGTYTFRLRQICQSGDTVTQTVDITAYPTPTFTAGTAFAFCGHSATRTMNATLPAGWTGVWRVVDYTNPGAVMTSRFSFTDITSPTATVTQITASCPDLSYGFVWEVTSPNGLCKYSQMTRGVWNPDTSTIGWTVPPMQICSGNTVMYAKAPGKCGYWNSYNTDYILSATMLTSPPGFTGPLGLGLSVSGVLNVTGFNVAGSYTFLVNLASPCGNKTFPDTFKVTVLPARPTITGGARTGICLKSAPANFSFSFTVSDSTTVFSVLSITGPSSLNYNLSASGYNRTITVTPVTNWVRGAYYLNFRGVSATDTAAYCPNDFTREIDIYDSLGFSMHIDPVSACIPVGSTTTTVNFPLPVYPTYFDFGGPRFLISKISGPGGGSNGGLMTWYATTGTLNNMPVGQYRYTIRPEPASIFAQEVACSPGPYIDTFSINVYNAVGANAGTDQNVNCIQNYALSGNNIANPSYGTWTQVSGPTTLSFNNNHSANAIAYNNITGTLPGTYIFRWATADSNGVCLNYADTVVVLATQSCPPSSPLPLNILSFDGRKANGQSLLTWRSANNGNIKAFAVEWSANATNDWREIAMISPGHGSDATQDYKYIHTAPEKTNYYRLREISKDGKNDFTSSVKLVFDGTGNVATVYPNPVDGTLNIRNLDPGSNLSLYNAAGVLVWKGTASSSSPQVEMSLYSPGIYLLSVLAGNGSDIQNLRIVKK